MDVPTILIIEDEPSFRSLLRFKMQRLGYHVLEAESGREGVILAKKHSPSVVICDFTMPQSELNGYQVWEALQHDPHLRSTPFILLSGQIDERWRQHWHPLLRTLDPISRQTGSTLRLVEKDGTSIARLSAILREFFGAPPSERNTTTNANKPNHLRNEPPHHMLSVVVPTGNLAW